MCHTCLRIFCFCECTLFAENKLFSIFVCVCLHSDIIRILTKCSSQFPWYSPQRSLDFYFIVFCILSTTELEWQVSLPVFTLSCMRPPGLLVVLTTAFPAELLEPEEHVATAACLCAADRWPICRMESTMMEGGQALQAVQRGGPHYQLKDDQGKWGCTPNGVLQKKD